MDRSGKMERLTEFVKKGAAEVGAERMKDKEENLEEMAGVQWLTDM